jgi:plasmid stabilization system protein ParE
MLVSFHDLAQLELNEAARYYESESPGLGQAFITAVERCTDEIVQYPEAGLVVRGSIRRRLIRRFPYALLYRVKPTEVRILAVMNLKRRPAYWVGRS